MGGKLAKSYGYNELSKTTKVFIRKDFLPYGILPYRTTELKDFGTPT